MRTLSFFFQAEDGIRDLVRSRGLGDVYKRQNIFREVTLNDSEFEEWMTNQPLDDQSSAPAFQAVEPHTCLLYTSDAADERSSVDLGGRRILKKKTRQKNKTQKKKTKNMLKQSTIDKIGI